MKKKLIQRVFVPVFLLLWMPSIVKATIYNDNGSSNTYNLYNGDVLNIKSGTYTGRIQTFESGATIKVMAGATLKPDVIKFPHGNIINSGTTILSFPASTPDEFDPLAGFGLDNYGRVQITGKTYTNGEEIWINRFGATIELMGVAEFNPGVDLTNNGTIISNANLFIHGNTKFLNNNIMDAKGNVSFNGGATINKGTIQAKGSIYYNLGTDHTNSCRLITESSFEVYNNFINDGFILVKGNPSSKKFMNAGYGTLMLKPNSIIKTPDFVNYSSISGNGALYLDRKSVV